MGDLEFGSHQTKEPTCYLENRAARYTQLITTKVSLKTLTV